MWQGTVTTREGRFEVKLFVDEDKLMDFIIHGGHADGMFRQAKLKRKHKTTRQGGAIKIELRLIEKTG